MSDFFQIVSVILAALWWGGIVTIDFIETPLRSQTPRVDKAVAGAIGRYVFHQYNYVQLGLGAAVLVVVILGGAEIAIPLMVLFMLGLTALSVFLLEPILLRLAAEDVETVEAQHTRRRQQLHRALILVDVFKVILGGALLSALVMAG